MGDGIVMNLQKGDVIQIEIDDLAFGGDRVGHYQGLAVFLDKGIPGEIVKAKIVFVKKNYARGKVYNIKRKSQDRHKPRCPVYEDCGGCQLQELNYNKQLLYKKKMVDDALQRIGEIDKKTNCVIGCEYPWHYRNKAQFPLTKTAEGQIRAGFYKRGSHRVVVNERCPIQHQLINRIAEKTIKKLNTYEELTVYNENNNRGLLRHLVIRVGICTNQALLVLVTNKEEFPYLKEIADNLIEEIPELMGVMQNINNQKTNVIFGESTKLIAGKNKIIDYIGNVKYSISPDSFFQVNTLQAEKLYNVIRDFADLKGNTVCDCYCGIGSIGLYLADKAKKVIGIEKNKSAIKMARKNASLNKIDNIKYILGKVNEGLNKFVNNNDQINIFIFDPPRKGLKEEVIAKTLKLKPDKIVYVSCNPSTQARDLKILSEEYILDKIQAIDMFPQTYHVETVALLKRDN